MKRSWLRGLLFVATLFAGAYGATAEAGGWARRYAAQYPWHYNYYDPAWTPQPHALVVPPTTCRHVEYNWGVTGTELQRIPHQYQQGFGGGSSSGGYYAPAPVQPTSTNQMGVYYIRGPW